MPSPRAFQISPNKLAFTQSPHGSRNTFATQIQMAVALLNRVGYAKLWYNPTNGGIEAIGPMYAPSGAPTAIDPCFLTATMTWTWSGTANDGTNLAATTSATITWDAKFQDYTCAPDTNVPIIGITINQVNLTRGGLGSTFGTPPDYTSSVPPAPTPVHYKYDTGDASAIASHSETNTPTGCTGYCIYNTWNDGSYQHVALRVDWSLSNPIQFKTYVKYCDQLLQAITLLDAVTNPAKNYLTSSSSTYLRYPLEFQPFLGILVPSLHERGVANSILAYYDRASSPQWDWYFALDSGVNDGGYYCTFYNLVTAGTGVRGEWINILSIPNPLGFGFDTQVNFNVNPLFAHGCPCASMQFPLVDELPLDMSKLAGTPSAPTDNVSAIFSVKTAMNTKKVTSSKAWVYDPSTNAWTLNTFSPSNSATQAGNFIYDPVANLAAGDVPSGYVLNPVPGVYSVDTTSPFTPASVDTKFGFVTGTI